MWADLQETIVFVMFPYVMGILGLMTATFMIAIVIAVVVKNFDEGR